MSVINGTGFPVMRIYDLNGAFIEKIDLPLPGAEGLEQNYEEKEITYENLNNEISKKSKGKRIYFKISYNEGTYNSESLNLIKLINYGDGNYKLYLQPRNDVGANNYLVIDQNKSIRIALLRGGEYSPGIKGIVLNYVTKGLVGSINAVDPNIQSLKAVDYENFIII